MDLRDWLIEKDSLSVLFGDNDENNHYYEQIKSYYLYGRLLSSGAKARQLISGRNAGSVDEVAGAFEMDAIA